MLSHLRNLGRAGGLAKAALSSNQHASAGIASSSVVQDKIVAVLYKAGEAAQEKKLLGISPYRNPPISETGMFSERVETWTVRQAAFWNTGEEFCFSSLGLFQFPGLACLVI